MRRFRVGLSTQVLHSSLSATAVTRADLLTAKSAGVDSFWVADHLNSLFPRAIATPEHLGVARFVTTFGSLPVGDVLGVLVQSDGDVGIV